MRYDKLDECIKRAVVEKPGSPIAEIIRPFLKIRCESSLRQRVRGLELQGLIRFEKTRKEVFVYPVA
jgi:hypothetical protein